MDLTNAAGLRAAIAEVINRADLDATIPAWVAMAESGFNQTLRLRPMIRREQAVFSGPWSVLPTDFLEMKSVSITREGRPHKLIYASEEIMDDIRAWHLYPRHATHFTVVGSEMEIAPVRDDTLTDVSMTYYSTIPALDTTSSASTNWLLAKSPAAYLYSALLHSAPYLVEDDRIQVWQSLASAAIQSLQTEDDGSTHNGSVMRERFRPIG